VLLPLHLNLFSREPAEGATLESARVSGFWSAPGAIRTENYTMDGIPTITVTQGQWPTLYASMRTLTGALVNQALVQAVTVYVFAPAVSGGTPVDTDHPAITTAVYDEEQTSVDGFKYNVAHTFELDFPPEASGGSSYTLELVVELTTGEKLTQRGRVLIQPTLHTPAGAY
jgi:hypothetical protein